MNTHRPVERGFTLVELLVVIGIIAILMGILIPTLTRARESANLVKCSSNARQLGLAIRTFAEEHRGFMPAASDHDIVVMNDPSRQIWTYRTDPGSQPKVYDWASALLPYLGARGVDSFFVEAARSKSKVYVCPSDRWQDLGAEPGQPEGPGMTLYNNVVPYNGKFPISYGINVDIAGLTVPAFGGRVGRLGKNGSEFFAVYGGPAPNTGKYGIPLGGRFYKVHKPAETMLLADCGTRPTLPSNTHTDPSPLMRSDILMYSSHGAKGGTLKDLNEASNQDFARKIAWDRHKGRIDVVFCDGHAETIQKGDAWKVRISPYRWEK
jgi:prepilin-type N-terminal cleavage/methylation domain-containing protein/prepilin-type processing-associated H-X9-DG protein